MIFDTGWFVIAYLVLLFLNGFAFVLFERRERKLYPEEDRNER